MRGFSLIELLMVLGIMAILATIAYPSYLEGVRKGRRIDATKILLNIHIAQERYRFAHPGYAADPASLGWSTDPLISEGGYYEITVNTWGQFAEHYQAVAVPRSGTDQAKDRCGRIVIDEQGPNLTASSLPECWAR